MTIATIAAIAVGGAVGAVSRHSVNQLAAHVLGAGFPWGTLIVNVLGSFLMGVIISSLAHFWQPPAAVKPMIVTGFLGAFTTFSTFSLDVATLYERSAYLPMALYFLASVTFSIAALFAGMILIRTLST